MSIDRLACRRRFLQWISASPLLPYADACGIGRPYLWGLGAFGEPGVAKVLELLRTEFRAAMMQCGVQTVKGFTPEFVRKV